MTSDHNRNLKSPSETFDFHLTSRRYLPVWNVLVFEIINFGSKVGSTQHGWNPSNALTYCDAISTGFEHASATSFFKHSDDE